MSYRAHSNFVDLSTYSEFLSLKSYTRATPISVPDEEPALEVLSLYSFTIEVVLIPTGILPYTLFSIICLPMLNGIDSLIAVAVCLGLLISI